MQLSYAYCLQIKTKAYELKHIKHVKVIPLERDGCWLEQLRLHLSGALEEKNFFSFFF
jgi:hypothetical protein